MRHPTPSLPPHIWRKIYEESIKTPGNGGRNQIKTVSRLDRLGKEVAKSLSISEFQTLVSTLKQIRATIRSFSVSLEEAFNAVGSGPNVVSRSYVSMGRHVHSVASKLKAQFPFQLRKTTGFSNYNYDRLYALYFEFKARPFNVGITLHVNVPIDDDGEEPVRVHVMECSIFSPHIIVYSEYSGERMMRGKEFEFKFSYQRNRGRREEEEEVGRTFHNGRSQMVSRHRAMLMKLFKLSLFKGRFSAIEILRQEEYKKELLRHPRRWGYLYL
jgi:hypothetical protein